MEKKKLSLTNPKKGNLTPYQNTAVPPSSFTIELVVCFEFFLKSGRPARRTDGWMDQSTSSSQSSSNENWFEIFHLLSSCSSRTYELFKWRSWDMKFRINVCEWNLRKEGKEGNCNVTNVESMTNLPIQIFSIRKRQDATTSNTLRDGKFANLNLAIRRRIPQRPIRCVGVHQLPIPLMSQKRNQHVVDWRSMYEVVANSIYVAPHKQALNTKG